MGVSGHLLIATGLDASRTKLAMDRARSPSPTNTSPACSRSIRMVMSTARKNSLTRLLEESVSHRVIETAPMPVQIVAGEAVSKLKRYGPAGVGAATALLAAVAASPVAPIWRLRIAGERS